MKDRKSKFFWDSESAALMKRQIEAQREARRIEGTAYYEGRGEAATPAGRLTYFEADESWMLDGRPITRSEAVAALALAEAD